MSVSSPFPFTSEVWDVTFEWSNWTTGWEINSTEIVTTEKPVIKPPETPPITGTRFAMAILMCVIIPISILGNSAVLYAIAKTRSLQRPNTMMYLSLSMADFLRTLFCMPFFTYALFTNDWDIPEELCPSYHAFYIMVRFVTILNLTVISLERLIIITRPLLYHRKATKTAMLRLIAIIWAISLVYGLLNILWFFDLDSYIDMNSEDTSDVNIPCRFEPNFGFVIFDFILTFIVPLAIMFVVYVQIFLVVHSQMKKIQPKINRSTEIETRETTFYKRPSSSNAQSNQVTSNKNKYTLHTKRLSQGSHDNSVSTLSLTDCGHVTGINEQYETQIRTNNLSDIDDKCDNLNTSEGQYKFTQDNKVSGNIIEENCENKTIIAINGQVQNCEAVDTLSNEARPLKNSDCKIKSEDCLKNGILDGGRIKSACSVQFRLDEHDCQTNDNISVLSSSSSENSASLQQNSTHKLESKNSFKLQHLNVIQESKNCSNGRITSAKQNGTHRSHMVDASPKTKAPKQSNNKAIKLSIGVIGTFILCFAPFEISFLIETACPSCIGDIAWMIVNTLAFLTSAVNPFVYSLYSSEFRTVMKKLVTCKEKSY